MHKTMYWVGRGTAQVLQCIHEGDNEAASTKLFFLGCLLFFLLCCTDFTYTVKP